MPDVLELPYITKAKLSDLDFANLKAAKNQVYPDGLVSMRKWMPGDEVALAFGYSDQDDLPPGCTFFLIQSAHHASLVPALRAMIYGLDDEWQEDVWNVGLIGGK